MTSDKKKQAIKYFIENISDGELSYVDFIDYEDTEMYKVNQNMGANDLEDLEVWVYTFNLIEVNVNWSKFLEGMVKSGKRISTPSLNNYNEYLTDKYEERINSFLKMLSIKPHHAVIKISNFEDIPNKFRYADYKIKSLKNNK